MACPVIDVDGILNLNKPSGITSFGVVAQVRKLTGCRRVGHAGTLDPDATGVILLCLGQATRISGTLSDVAKIYRVEVQLGIATDTYDSSGKVLYSGDISHIGLEHVEKAAGLFRGVIQQRPPIYSALKIKGRRLYELARSGVPVMPEKRIVQVYRLEVKSWSPPMLKMEIECSKGTYIRSIANDLGEELECGAHVFNLTRTRCGHFCIEDSLSIFEFEQACRAGYWEKLLHNMDDAATHWPSAVLGEKEALFVKHGRPITLQMQNDYRNQDAKTYCRAYTVDGTFIAIMEFEPDDNRWHPRKVFATNSC